MTVEDVQDRYEQMEAGGKINYKLRVWNGTIEKTPGGLTRADLMKTKSGRIVSKAKHAAGLRAYKNIRKYTLPKGTKNLKSRLMSKSRKMRTSSAANRSSSRRRRA